MSNPDNFKTRTAGGLIRPYRIVKHGAADLTVVEATAATDALYGVTQQLGAAVAGNRVDVCLSDLPEIEYGGAVTRGDAITADSVGRAVHAIPAAGSNVRIIGFAEVSGVAGDIVAFQFAPGMIQG